MKKIIVSLFALAVIAMPFSASTPASAGSDITQVIYPGNEMGWSFFQETPSLVPLANQFVSGPDASNVPAGIGSANLNPDNSTIGEAIGKLGYAGTRFDQITELTYWTYRTSGGPAPAPSLQFNIDNDLLTPNDGWKGRAVFEPYFTETVLDNTWQQWNAQTQGKWWVTTSGAVSCVHASPCTWAELLTAYPNIGVNNGVSLGAVLFKVGSGVSGFDGNVDKFVIKVNDNRTTYDFELDNPDADNDGVLNVDDLCEEDTETDAGTWTDYFNMNRYQYNAEKKLWQTVVPTGTGKKVTPKITDTTITLKDTYGCSGQQILDLVSDLTDSDMSGHYKYGLSKGLLESFILDGTDGLIDGLPGTVIDEFELNSNDMDGVNSMAMLEAGKNYRITVDGTWTNRPSETVDPAYTTMDGWSTNFPGPQGWEDDLLEVQVNRQFQDWGDYSDTHTYSLIYTPTATAQANFVVFDGDVTTNTINPGWYGDNVGTMNVTIEQFLY